MVSVALHEVGFPGTRSAMKVIIVDVVDVVDMVEHGASHLTRHG